MEIISRTHYVKLNPLCQEGNGSYLSADLNKHKINNLFKGTPLSICQRSLDGTTKVVAMLWNFCLREWFIFSLTNIANLSDTTEDWTEMRMDTGVMQN